MPNRPAWPLPGRAPSICLLPALRLQAFSLSLIDGFLLIAWSCVCALILVALLRKSPLNYGDLSSMQQIPGPREGVEINEAKQHFFCLWRRRCLALLPWPRKQAVLRRHATSHCRKPFSWPSSTTTIFASPATRSKRNSTRRRARRVRIFHRYGMTAIFMHMTDTELIEIKAGSLGIAGGTPIPPAGCRHQPRRQELHNQRNPDHPAVDDAAQDQTGKRFGASRVEGLAREGAAYGKRCGARGPSGLLPVLIAQAHRSAIGARIKASEDLQERARRTGKVRQFTGTGPDRQPRPTAASQAGTADDRPSVGRSET